MGQGAGPPIGQTCVFGEALAVASVAYVALARPAFVFAALALNTTFVSAAVIVSYARNPHCTFVPAGQTASYWNVYVAGS